MCHFCRLEKKGDRLKEITVLVYDHFISINGSEACEVVPNDKLPSEDFVQQLYKKNRNLNHKQPKSKPTTCFFQQHVRWNLQHRHHRPPLKGQRQH